MFNSKAQLIVWTLLLSMTIGCTREVSELSKVKVKIPKHTNQTSGVGMQSISTQNSVFPRMIFINITFGGEKIVKKWDNCRECANPLAPPVFEFDLPSGEDPLIQVLAVYKDSNGYMLFKYGDAKKTLEPGDQSVTIDITTVGGASETSKVAGHWKRADSSTYTGKLTMNVIAKAGRPPMVIEQTEMFAGWFEVFYMDSVPISWKLDTGEDLFGGPKSLIGNSSDTFDFSSLSIAKVALERGSIPKVYRDFNSDGNFAATEVEEYPDSVIWGWWQGSLPVNSASKVAVYDGSAMPLNEYSTATGALAALNWTSFVVNGEEALSGTQWSDYITIGGAWYRDSAPLGIIGPFKSLETDPFDPPYFYQIPGSNMNWSYLPGVEAGIDGVKVFRNTNTTNAIALKLQDSEHLGIKCNDLPAMGYTLIATVAHPTATVSLGGPLGTRETVVLCPYKGTQTFDTLLFTGCPNSPDCEMAELKVTSVTNGEFDFGTVVWDTATEEYQRGSPQTFTITNVGDITATSIGDPILSNGIHFGYYNSVGPYSGGYPGTGGSCSASSFDLSPGQSCTVQIVAKPDAGPSGTEFAYFTMDYYSNGSHINGAQLLYLTQTPKIRGNFGFSPASGVVIPNSQTQTVTITNNGEANITNLSLTWSNLLSGGFTQTNNCGTTLAGGDSCTASITAGTGSHSAALILNFNDGINASAQTTFNFNTSP